MHGSGRSQKHPIPIKEKEVSHMVTASKSPVPQPGENVEPEPLPAKDAELLAEVFDYADQIAAADSATDSVAMQKAAALEALYTSETWVAEWLEIKPAKPNAAGRPTEPNSRNRFNQWMAWRASKSNRKPLGANYTYRLLNARKVQTYFANWQKKSLTESAVRPIVWMLSRHYEDRIKEVEQIAIELANGAPITDKITRKAMSEWKKQNLGDRGVVKANREAKARNYRPKADAAFDQLMADDFELAKQFLKDCVAKMKRAAGESA